MILPSMTKMINTIMLLTSTIIVLSGLLIIPTMSMACAAPDPRIRNNGAVALTVCTPQRVSLGPNTSVVGTPFFASPATVADVTVAVSNNNDPTAKPPKTDGGMLIHCHHAGTYELHWDQQGPGNNQGSFDNKATITCT